MAYSYNSLFDDEQVANIGNMSDDELTAMLAVKMEQFDNLISLKERLSASGRITSALAMEAVEIYPEFSKHMPLSIYAEEHDGAYTAVAMEEVSLGLIGLITAAILAVLALINRIMLAFRGKAEKGKEQGRSGGGFSFKFKFEEPLSDVGKKS